MGHEENKQIFDDKEDHIIIQEKIDGANARFTFINGKVIFGSRTQQLTSDEGEDTNVAKDFRRVLSYIRDKVDSYKKQYNSDLGEFHNMLFYGEAMFKHTMPYNWETIPPFLGFDIMKEDKYLDYDTTSTIFKDLRFEMVPLITRCAASEIAQINEDYVPVCKYPPLHNPSQKAEGIVLKNYSKQLFGKFVRNEFKEKNAEAFGGNPKYNKEDDTHNAEFIFKYCTNARIDKIIFKLMEEGHKLELPMMKYLPKQVYLDIWEEHWQEIRDSNWKIDIRKLRVTIPKRCVNVLQQVITNNAFGG